jgi:hypothetical protein
VTRYLTLAALLTAITLYVKASQVAARILVAELARCFDSPAVGPALDASQREPALAAAGALAVLGGGFENNGCV